MSEAAAEPTVDPTPAPEAGPEADEQQEQTFKQADVDRIVRERVKREREKFADYDDLKAKAGEATTAEERIAKLEKEIQTSQHEALKRRVQARHGISDDDADLFLTGTDEDTLTAQAERLAAREAERKQNGNHVPREGNNPAPGTGSTEESQLARSLFGPPAG
jgi:hypothetical protein